jgi:hypothetical protein
VLLRFRTSFQQQSFHSPAASELLLPLRKSNQKARRPTQCCAAHQRSTMPCASRLRRGSLDAHHCAFANARAFGNCSCVALPPASMPSRARAPAGINRRSLRCSAPRKAPGSANPSIHGLRLSCVALLLIRVPLCCGEGTQEKSVRMTRRMRVSSRTYRDVRQANPCVTSRTRRAKPAERGIGGAFLLVTFLWAHKEK